MHIWCISAAQVYIYEVGVNWEDWGELFGESKMEIKYWLLSIRPFPAAAEQ